MDISILQLWLPIVLATVAVWFASGLIHMALKYHNADYKELSNEDEVAAAIRNGSPGLGVHTLPHCSDMKKMGDENFQKKFEKGPVAMLTILPSGMPNMAVLMPQQIVYFLLGGLLIAYRAALGLSAGDGYMTVFRFVSAVAFLAYGWANIPFSIWYGFTWGTTFRYLIDALIYALLTAGIFAWLWPAAT